MGSADHLQSPCVCTHPSLSGGLGSLLPPYYACTHSNPKIYINLSILKLLTTALIHFILFWYIANILPCVLLLILLEKIQKFPRFFNLFSKRVDKTLKKANPHLLSFVFYYSHFGCLRNFSWYTNHWLNQDAIFYKPQGFLFTVFLKHLYFSEFTFLNFHKTFQETRVALLSERIVDERFLNTPALP